MIDEIRLDEIERQAFDGASIQLSDYSDLIRLARLGIWAKEYGSTLSELLTLIENGTLVRNVDHDHEPGFALRMLGIVPVLRRAQDAIDALPKDKP